MLNHDAYQKSFSDSTELLRLSFVPKGVLARFVFSVKSEMTGNNDLLVDKVYSLTFL